MELYREEEGQTGNSHLAMSDGATLITFTHSTVTVGRRVLVWNIFAINPPPICLKFAIVYLKVTLLLKMHISGSHERACLSKESPNMPTTG